VPGDLKPTLPESLADRYALERRLAVGGSAEVWAGTDRVLERVVAVKVFHRHLLVDDTFRTRLTREARTAATLSHPGIVAIYDVAIDADAAAIIFELVEGSSVAERLRESGALPARQAARIGAEVAEALEHAHERGVVHRDIKPANVLLGPEGEARVVDFGIARLVDDTTSRLTSDGTIAGTLGYLAPEQLRGEEAGPPADIFAVGVLVAEMVSGSTPYVASTPLALAEAHQAPPMAIEGVSPSLFAVVRPAIDPDPTKRPPSAGALAGELRAWLEADAMPAAPADPAAVTEMAIPVPLPPDQVVPDQAAPDQQEPPPPPANAPRSRPAPPTPPGRRPPRLAVALATLALVIIAILAVMALAAPGAKPEPPFPSVSPSLVPSPSQTPVATPVVTPAPPTFEEAVAQFRALVDSGSEAGQLDGDAAEELRERLDEVVAAVNEGHPGQINRAFRDLRRAIGDIEQDEASPELVADLLALADAMQAAT
jgi:serine/threonine-protein kinase